MSERRAVDTNCYIFLPPKKKKVLKYKVFLFSLPEKTGVNIKSFLFSPPKNGENKVFYFLSPKYGGKNKKFFICSFTLGPS